MTFNSLEILQDIQTCRHFETFWEHTQAWSEKGVSEMSLARDVVQVKLNLWLGYVIERRFGHVAQVEFHVRFRRAEERLHVRLNLRSGSARIVGMCNRVVKDDLGLVRRASIVECWCAFHLEGEGATDDLNNMVSSNDWVLSGVVYLHASNEPREKRLSIGS